MLNDLRREQDRAAAYPLSRWYLRPAAGRLAAALAPSGISPHWLTLGNLFFAAAAAAWLYWQPSAAPATALLVLAAWFCDRADGQLARRQRTASRFGAWLDANVDELTDLGLHVAVASAAAATTGSVWPWRWLVAFLAGKYLLMYGLAVEDKAESGEKKAESRKPKAESGGPKSTSRFQLSAFRLSASAFSFQLSRIYHLPGNADVRVHLLAGALLTGWLTAELAAVASYYNLRWIVRYGLVARRMRGGR
jgi:phosphatidylglycerophosphate synthase